MEKVFKNELLLQSFCEAIKFPLLGFIKEKTINYFQLLLIIRSLKFEVTVC
jgi:hypothetical protein